MLSARNTAAAAEEAAKKEAEASQLAKKKGMQTLQVRARASPWVSAPLPKYLGHSCKAAC